MSKYFEGQEQKMLKRYSIEQLASFFKDNKNAAISSESVAKGILEIGLRHEPSEFQLTDIELSLSEGGDEIVYKVEYKHAGKKETIIRSSHNYLESRRYALYDVIDDIYTGIKEIAEDYLPEEYEDTTEPYGD
jgi:hypothetical protein